MKDEMKKLQVTINNVDKEEANDPFEIFNYKNLGKVRTRFDESGEPWFCLQDICYILEIKNPWNVASRINDPYLHTTEVWVQTGLKADGTPAMRSTNMNFVNEAGLYQAIGDSKKREAKKFMLWIFTEVIPSIRKNGYYIDKRRKVSLREMFNTMLEQVDENTEDIVWIKDNMITKSDLEKLKLEQDKVLRQYAHSVRGYANMIGIDLDTETARKIGVAATQYSNAMGSTVVKVPDDRYGLVNGYAYDIIKYAFNQILGTKDIN